MPPYQHVKVPAGGQKITLNKDFSLNVPDNAVNFTLREPVGVAALIIPWNYPLMMVAWKLGPGAGAGPNGQGTVVV